MDPQPNIAVQNLIRTLTNELELVRTRRAEQRRGRQRHGWALVSIVGYTNAGKSTFLNRLAGAGSSVSRSMTRGIVSTA